MNIKMIFIYFVISILIRVTNSNIEPSIAMCIDGEIDTAVLTRDGSTYMFMNKWFWKLNQNLDAVSHNGSRISDHWFNLPESIDTSFYVTGNTNRLNGKTFFVKNGIWYQFDNQVFELNGSTQYWQDFPKGSVLAITEYNDPIIVFYQKNNNKRRAAYYFDSPYFPDSKAILKENLPFDTSITQAIISYPKGNFLIFFDDERVGEHCIMKDSDSGCVISRLNRDFFQCPDYTQNLFNKNLFVKFWYWSGLGVKQFAILVIGVLFSLCLILLFLLLILSLRLRTFIKRKFHL